MAQESIASLIDEIRLALRGLSQRNPNRQLLTKCAVALTSLANDLHQAKQATRPTPWYRRLFRRIA